MAEVPTTIATTGPASTNCENVPVSIDIARKDGEVLLQLVESSLFMRGEAIAEGDIADTLGIPLVAIRGALQSLSKRYESYAGAIRVREIDDGVWLMDLREEVSEHVDTFYLEQKPYTRSEVMTLAFVAFAQPVPRQVLSFYRGSNAGSHARKLVEAGFVKEESLNRDDPRLKDIVAKYKQDVADRLASAPGQLSDPEEGKTEKKSRDSWLDRADFMCYATTNRFCG
jgi:chromosome segregation and condensation protein ScpB